MDSSGLMLILLLTGRPVCIQVAMSPGNGVQDREVLASLVKLFCSVQQPSRVVGYLLLVSGVELHDTLSRPHQRFLLGEQLIMDAQSWL